MPQEDYGALRSAIRRMRNPVFVFDAGGLLRPMNKSAAELAAAEHLNERIFTDRPSHPVSKVLRETLVAGSESSPSNAIIALPSGRKIELEVSRTSEKGGARWMLLLFRDIQQSPVLTPEDLAERWGLTPREAVVARHVLDGNTSTEICELLNISRDTLKTHLSSIFGKTNVRNRAELVTKLIR